MSSFKLKLLRARRLLTKAFADGWGQTLAPLTDSGARLNYVALLILLLILLPRRGRATELTMYIGWIETAEVFAWSLPVFFALNVFFGLFRVRKFEREAGSWVGNRFVYREPRLLLTALVDASDNDTPLSLEVADAEIGSIVAYVIELDRTDRRVRTQLVHEHGKPFMLDGEGIVHVPKGQFRLPSSRRMKILVRVAPEATLSTVRIYMTRWELGPGDGRG